MRTKKAKRVKENYDFVRGTFFFSRRKIIIAHKYNYGNMHIYKFALCSLTLSKLSNSLSLVFVFVFVVIETLSGRVFSSWRPRAELE